MPLIQVRLSENAYTPEQKKEMIARLTEAMVSIVDEALDPVTCVVIEKPGSGYCGIAGEPMTIEGVDDLVSQADCATSAKFKELLQYI